MTSKFWSILTVRNIEDDSIPFNNSTQLQSIKRKLKTNHKLKKKKKSKTSKAHRQKACPKQCSNQQEPILNLDKRADKTQKKVKKA